jgi:hypothetical protein
VFNALAFGVRGHIPRALGAFDAAFVAGRRVMKHTAALLALAAASVLGIAACGGGGGAPAAPAASHTTSPAASPSPLHTAQPGEPALIAVPGYAYTDPASADVASAKDILKSDPQVLKSVSAHNVLRGGTEIGGIILVQVKPRYANLPEVQQAMMPEMAKAMTGSGAKVARETIHTEKVVITSQSGHDVYVWYHAHAITIVVADSGNGSDIRGFVEAYLKTANA